MSGVINIQTDFSHLKTGFYLPFIKIKLDFLDFAVIVANFVVFFIVFYGWAYQTYGKKDRLQLQVQPSKGQDIPYFSIAKSFKKKMHRDTKQQSFQFKCQKCHYQQQVIDKH